MGFLGDWIKAVIVGPNRTARLWLASLLIAACGVAALHRALQEPSLGWRFSVGPQSQMLALPTTAPVALQGVTALSADGVSVALTPELLIESAGIHNDYAVQNRFFEQHRQIWELLQAPQVEIHHAGGATLAAPRSRGIGELGPRFWFPWLVGLLSLSVGLAIWVYRPGDAASLCYLVASGGYAFGMLCTADWGSRLLTQPPWGWPELHVASHLGSFMVSGGLCALLWQRPRRLGGAWLPWLLAAAVGVLVAADAGQWVPTISLAFRLPIVLITALLGVLYAVQWRVCRADASQRAQLKWFGLLLFMGLSTVFVAYAVGATGRVVNVPQNYGLGTVALLFLGLVPMVTRVGIFRLEGWWPRAWLWFLGGLLVVVLDLLLVVLLDLNADGAFALALALAGWLYFPLRQLLWRRLSQGALPGTREVLPQILELVAHGQGERAQLNQRWRGLWEAVFQPQSMAAAPAGSAPGMVRDGQGLRVGAGAGLDVLELSLPGRGARLFNPADARRASEICELVRQGLASGEAFEQGARQERQRIASDLHDDLGAKLLTIAQAGGPGRVADLARQALEEMRLAVRGLTADAAPAADVLADWRAETVTRLAAAGLQPHWQAQEPPEGLVLPARTHVQLTRILREATSNVIRHSGAASCRVGIGFDADGMTVEVEDDGRGLAPAAVQAGGDDRGGGAGSVGGHGLPGIERRVRSLGGTYAMGTGAWGGVPGGARLRLRVPLGPPGLAGPAAG